MELRYFGNPRVGVQPHRPLSLFLAERGTRPGGISCGSSRPCVPGTRAGARARSNELEPTVWVGTHDVRSA